MDDFSKFSESSKTYLRALNEKRKMLNDKGAGGGEEYVKGQARRAEAVKENSRRDPRVIGKPLTDKAKPSIRQELFAGKSNPKPPNMFNQATAEHNLNSKKNK